MFIYVKRFALTDMEKHGALKSFFVTHLFNQKKINVGAYIISQIRTVQIIVIVIDSRWFVVTVWNKQDQNDQ